MIKKKKQRHYQGRHGELEYTSYTPNERKRGYQESMEAIARKGLKISAYLNAFSIYHIRTILLISRGFNSQMS